jgi:ferredoxin
MPQITVAGFPSFAAPTGQRLVLALEQGGIDMLHRCGGKARCTTCLVTFSSGEPSTMTEAEKTVLEAKGLLGQGRLSCQMRVDTADMHLTPARTVSSSGLEAGTPALEQIEPEPVWI